MAVAFNPGQTTIRGDLDIYLTNSQGVPANAYSISYGIYYVDPATEAETLIGSSTRTPVNPAVGEYYAALTIPTTAVAGTYRIRWTFKETATIPAQTVVMEWAVVSVTGDTATSYSTYEQQMIDKLRILLRDNNPDRNYHFRPPEHEGTIGCYNQVFGYVWTDEELLEYLERALDWWNMLPPETENLCSIDKLVSMKPAWRTAVLWGAIVHACFALATNWVQDEFSYSIGGISLDIDKSSKFESLKQNAEGQLDKAADAKLITTKFIRGLQQPRYGQGVRSSFGPAVGRGVLSPRNFWVWTFSLLGGKILLEVLTHASHMPSLWS